MQAALGRFKGLLDSYQEEVGRFGNFPSLFLGLVRPDGAWEHYDGRLRFVDAPGQIVADELDPARYQDFIGEAVEPSSYLKSPYYRPLGYPGRHLPRRPAGPAQRLHAHGHAAGRPRAGGVPPARRRPVNVLVLLPLRPPDRDPGGDRAHRAAAGRPRPAVASHLRADAGVNQLEGVGVSEAPRGTLFHHYQVDENGLIREGEPDHRHGPEQPGHEPHGRADRPALHPRAADSRRRCSTASRPASAPSTRA